MTRKGQDLLAVGGLMAALAISGSIAMLQIRVSQKPLDFGVNPSPYGYTFSLLCL